MSALNRNTSICTSGTASTVSSEVSTAASLRRGGSGSLYYTAYDELLELQIPLLGAFLLKVQGRQAQDACAIFSIACNEGHCIVSRSLSVPNSKGQHLDIVRAERKFFLAYEHYILPTTLTPDEVNTPQIFQYELL